MLKRKLMDQLLEWKSQQNKKCLMIRGARQVGKTYLVRKLGETYPSFVELNFIEHPDYKSIFSGALDVKTLLLNLSAFLPGPELNPGKTLIFFDEIQDCPEALSSLKFWTQDGQYDVIATGSSLGIEYKNENSFPVGYVKSLEMTALDFEEFLWAKQIADPVLQALESCYHHRTAVPAALHARMLHLLKEYLIVGGMPETVKTYIATGDMKKTDEVQRQIYADYLSNMAHYAPLDIRIRAERCYRSIPFQLSKENHKFQYKVVEKGSTASRYVNCLDWLEKAFLISPVHQITEISFPLESFQDDASFRIYPTDIGLLMAAYPFQVKAALLEDQRLEDSPTNLSIGTAKGGIYEALAADMLYKRGYRNLSFLKDKKSTREIEFFLTAPDGLVPVEIKAGRNKANSLGHILENPLVPYGYKISSQNVGVSGKRITLPLYMLMFL